MISARSGSQLNPGQEPYFRSESTPQVILLARICGTPADAGQRKPHTPAADRGAGAGARSSANGRTGDGGTTAADWVAGAGSHRADAGREPPTPVAGKAADAGAEHNADATTTVGRVTALGPQGAHTTIDGSGRHQNHTFRPPDPNQLVEPNQVVGRKQRRMCPPPPSDGHTALGAQRSTPQLVAPSRTTTPDHSEARGADTAGQRADTRTRQWPTATSAGPDQADATETTPQTPAAGRRPPRQAGHPAPMPKLRRARDIPTGHQDDQTPTCRRKPTGQSVQAGSTAPTLRRRTTGRPPQASGEPARRPTKSRGIRTMTSGLHTPSRSLAEDRAERAPPTWIGQWARRTGTHATPTTTHLERSDGPRSCQYNLHHPGL